MPEGKGLNEWENKQFTKEGDLAEAQGGESKDTKLQQPGQGRISGRNKQEAQVQGQAGTDSPEGHARSGQKASSSFSEVSWRCSTPTALVVWESSLSSGREAGLEENTKPGFSWPLESSLETKGTWWHEWGSQRLAWLCGALFGEGNGTQGHNSSVISLPSPELAKLQGLSPGAGCVMGMTKGTPRPLHEMRPCRGMICCDRQTHGLSTMTLRSRTFRSCFSGTTECNVHHSTRLI